MGLGEIGKRGTAGAAEPDPRVTCYRFGPFELRPQSGELRKYGVRVRLQEQPLQVLIMLLAHPDEVVLREDIQVKLWFRSTAGEFDQGINAAIRRLRTTLGDSAEAPRFIETVPRRGYRFIAPVETGVREPIPEAATLPPAPQVRPFAQRKRIFMGAGIATGLLGCLSALLLGRQPPATYDLGPPSGTILAGAAVLSPDGRQLVAPVVDTTRVRKLWVRSLDSGVDRILPDTNDALHPFWSPRGTAIGYFAGSEFRQRVLSAPNSQRVIGALGSGGGAWAPDNTILYSPVRLGPLSRLNLNEGGAEQPATRLTAGEVFGHTSPVLLPDARHFLFLAPSRDADKSGVYLGTIGSLDRQLLLSGVSTFDFAPPHYLLYLRAGGIEAQNLDLATGRLTGAPIPIVSGRDSSAIADFSSRNDILVYRSGARGDQADLIWRDRGGQLAGRVAKPTAYWQIFLSPDNSRVAMNTGESGSTLSVFDLNTQALTILDSRPSPHLVSILDGIWSPDSRTLAYQLYGSNKTQLMTRNLAEPSSKTLLDDGNSNYPDAWSPDGKWILGRRVGNVVIAVPTGGGIPQTLLQAEYLMDQFQFSPDGKWVVFNSDESGQWEVQMARFPEMDHLSRLSTTGGCQPLWRSDGKELFYVTPDARLMSISFPAGPASGSDAPVTLFQSNLLVNCIFAQYAVSANGQKFLMIEPRIGDASESPGPLHVVSNWMGHLTASQH